MMGSTLVSRSSGASCSFFNWFAKASTASLLSSRGSLNCLRTSLQTRMIKTGGRLVRHAGRLVFQLAEVLVSREMLGGILERIGRLRLAPG